MVQLNVFSAPNVPVPFAINLEQLYIPNPNRVIEAATELIDDLKA